MQICFKFYTNYKKMKKNQNVNSKKKLIFFF